MTARLLVRKVLVSALFAFALLAVVPCRAASTLTLAHIYAPEHPTAKACQFFADAVKSRSRGRLLINVYGEASMGNQTPILHSLRNGSLDLAVLSQGSLSAIVPEFNALGLPYLFPSQTTAWRVLEGPIGQQLVHKLNAKGVVLLGYQNIEIRQLSNSVRPILRPADLVGLKIRVPPDPLAGEVISALGGKPQEINFSDMYKAMQQGVVDGQENPLLNFQTYRLYEVQKYISLTGHKYSIYALLMNKGSLEALSVADREIIRGAARDAALYQRALVRTAEDDAARDLAARGVRISRVDIRPFVIASAVVYDKWYASPIGGFVRSLVQAVQERE